MANVSSWRARILAASVFLSSTVVSIPQPSPASDSDTTLSSSEVEAKKIAPKMRKLFQEGTKFADSGACRAARGDKAQMDQLLDEHNIATPLNTVLPPFTTTLRNLYVGLYKVLTKRCDTPEISDQNSDCDRIKNQYLEQHPTDQWMADIIGKQCVSIKTGAPIKSDEFGPYARRRLLTPHGLNTPQN